VQQRTLQLDKQKNNSFSNVETNAVHAAAFTFKEKCNSIPITMAKEEDSLWTTFLRHPAFDKDLHTSRVCNIFLQSITTNKKNSEPQLPSPKQYTNQKSTGNT
jgi:hypothetical protein